MKKPFIIIGELRGSLAEHIGKLGSKTKLDGAATLFCGSHLETLSKKDTADLRASFEAGNPVMMIQPNYSEMKKLAEILNVHHAVSFPKEAVGIVDAYGLDMEAGVIWQATWMSSSIGQKRLTITHRDDDGVTMENSMDLGTYVMGDMDTQGALKAEKILEWVNLSGNRSKSELAVSSMSKAKSRLKNVGDGPNEITQLANAFVDQVYYTLRDNVGNLANYTVSSFAYSCYAQNNRDNWFYVQQYGVFSPSNVYTVDNKLQQYWYTDLYEQNSWPTNYKDSRLVNLIVSSPQTTINTATATSSVSYSISGTVGFEGKSGSGSVTGGMSVENSTTVEIPDVTINNRSLTTINNAAWQFVIPRSHGVDDGCVNDLSKVVGIAHNTFQPMNQWLWRVDDSVRDAGPLSVANTFVTRWINSYMGDCNIFGCNCDVNAQEWKPDLGIHYFSVPFPPKS